MVRYILVESPIDHCDLILLRRDLLTIGIDAPLLDIINCGLAMRGILTIPVARRWLGLKNRIIQSIFMPHIAMVDAFLEDKFHGFLPGVKIKCKAVAYENGEILLEVLHDVEWDVLSRFDIKR